MHSHQRPSPPLHLYHRRPQFCHPFAALDAESTGGRALEHNTLHGLTAQCVHSSKEHIHRRGQHLFCCAKRVWIRVKLHSSAGTVMRIAMRSQLFSWSGKGLCILICRVSLAWPARRCSMAIPNLAVWPSTLMKIETATLRLRPRSSGGFPKFSAGTDLWEAATIDLEGEDISKKSHWATEKGRQMELEEEIERRDGETEEAAGSKIR